VNKRANRDIYKENINMKEYIKLFEGLNAANGYEINDIPFTSTIKSVSGEDINLLCNKHNASIIIENGEPKILTEVTITGTWNPTYSSRKLKVIIQGEVILNGKVDCYSIEFAQGGHLTINPDARLRIWKGGIVNNDAETKTDGGYFTIKSELSGNETFPTKLGQFLLHPDIIINKQPKATVEYYTTCKKATTSERKWQRFTSPLSTYSSLKSNYFTLTPTPELIPGASTFKTWMQYYDEVNANWVAITNPNQLKAFTHYSWINNTVNGGITYTFKGNLQGNVANNIELTTNGWNYMGNSFISPMSISAILNKYNSIILLINEQAITITDTSIYKTIPPLGAFIIKNPSQQEGDFGISYKDLVWDPSFEEDTTPVPTRGLKSSPKSELILPDSPIFSDPIDAFADIDNSNLK